MTHPLRAHPTGTHVIVPSTVARAYRSRPRDKCSRPTRVRRCRPASASTAGSRTDPLFGGTSTGPVPLGPSIRSLILTPSQHSTSFLVARHNRGLPSGLSSHLVLQALVVVASATPTWSSLVALINTPTETPRSRSPRWSQSRSRLHPLEHCLVRDHRRSGRMSACTRPRGSRAHPQSLRSRALHSSMNESPHGQTTASASWSCSSAKIACLYAPILSSDVPRFGSSPNPAEAILRRTTTRTKTTTRRYRSVPLSHTWETPHKEGWADMVPRW
ncbi:hypothetical protein B0H14DRAFT_1118832 [Mycena olivaceomarginata]|nr:hypothetical protein B0H14DRAFT_1118832 [Mycena olivaceomarginata]